MGKLVLTSTGVARFANAATKSVFGNLCSCEYWDAFSCSADYALVSGDVFKVRSRASVMLPSSFSLTSDVVTVVCIIISWNS